MLGFTRNEVFVLLFLIITFTAGMGVWYYRIHWEPSPEISDRAQNEERTSRRVFGVEETGVVENDTIIVQISLNTAEVEDLVNLPGIGVSKAARIVEYRQRHGEFHSVDELIKVKGIGSKTKERIKPYLKLHE